MGAPSRARGVAACGGGQEGSDGRARLRCDEMGWDGACRHSPHTSCLLSSHPPTPFPPRAQARKKAELEYKRNMWEAAWRRIKFANPSIDSFEQVFEKWVEKDISLKQLEESVSQSEERLEAVRQEYKELQGEYMQMQYTGIGANGVTSEQVGCWGLFGVVSRSLSLSLSFSLFRSFSALSLSALLHDVMQLTPPSRTHPTPTPHTASPFPPHSSKSSTTRCEPNSAR